MKKCEICKKEAKYSQFSPDFGDLYFCSLGHYKKYLRENVYRACPLVEIKNNKEADNDKIWNLVICPCCGSKVSKKKLNEKGQI